MSDCYPVLLKLRGRLTVVIGGGYGTEDRVRALLAAGARVRLISPASTEQITRWVEQGRIEHLTREYAPGDLEGAFLVIACPRDRAHNARIWEEAEARGILMDAIDDSPHANFILPAIHRQRDLVVAVSSSGKSPALASRVRDRIARDLGPAYGEFLDLLGELRPEVIKCFPNFAVRREIWYRLVDSEALALLGAGDRDAALAALRSVLDEASAAAV
jgi:siroheme synthase-like protein